MNHFEKAVDALDAAIFSGDSLFEKDAQNLLEQSLERWQRKLASWKEIAAEIAAENAST